MSNFESIYILIYVVMAFTAFLLLLKDNSIGTNKLFIVFFSLIWLFFFGTRDFTIGSDTGVYVSTFNQFNIYKNIADVEGIKDIGYLSVVKLTSLFTKDDRTFLLFLEAFFILPIIIAFNKLKVNNLFLFFFTFCSFFFFKTMGVNIMRQGISVSFFLLGLVYQINSKNKWSYFFYAVAFTFHASIISLLIVIFLVKFIKKIQVPISIYIGSIVLSFFSFDFSFIVQKIPFFSFLVQERFAAYTESNDDDYLVGFRLSFVLFNTIFALIGYYFYKKNFNEEFFLYNKIYYAYLIISAVFFLMFNIPYSDRTGLLSWILIPFILIPFLNHNYLKHGSIKLFVFSVLLFVFFFNL